MADLVEACVGHLNAHLAHGELGLSAASDALLLHDDLPLGHPPPVPHVLGAGPT